MAELADALDLGSNAVRRVGSSPTESTNSYIGGISSVGRASALQAECHRFESDMLHQFMGP